MRRQRGLVRWAAAVGLLAESACGVDEGADDADGGGEEVTPDVSHLRFDLTQLLGPMLGEGDARAFAPGISFIDLDRLRTVGPELVAAIAGQGVVDLQVMAERLPEVMEDVQEDGSTFTGTTSYAELLATLGGDIESVARSVAGGVALNLAVDPAPSTTDDRTDEWVDYLENAGF